MFYSVHILFPQYDHIEDLVPLLVVTLLYITSVENASFIFILRAREREKYKR